MWRHALGLWKQNVGNELLIAQKLSDTAAARAEAQMTSLIGKVPIRHERLSLWIEFQQRPNEIKRNQN